MLRTHYLRGLTADAAALVSKVRMSGTKMIFKQYTNIYQNWTKKHPKFCPCGKNCLKKVILRGWQLKKTNKTNPKKQRTIVPKSTKNRSKIDSKSTPKRSKIGPKSAQEPTSLPRPFFVRFWLHFGPNLGHLGGPNRAMKGLCWPKNRSKKASENRYDFDHPWGPFWNRFWDGLGFQNRSKINPESVSRAMKQKMQKC